MKIDLDKMEQTAKAAQDYAPGDWMIDKMTSDEAYLAGNKDADDCEGYSVFASNHDRIIHDGEIHHDVVQHIAAFSPDVVLAMIARIREMEAGLIEAADIACVQMTQEDYRRMGELEALARKR